MENSPITLEEIPHIKIEFTNFSGRQIFAGCYFYVYVSKDSGVKQGDIFALEEDTEALFRSGSGGSMALCTVFVQEVDSNPKLPDWSVLMLTYVSNNPNDFIDAKHIHKDKKLYPIGVDYEKMSQPFTGLPLFIFRGNGL